MALVFADRVKVRSYSIGTGEFLLESVSPGFQSFSAVGNGNECYYGIEDHAGNWEVGRGTYSTDSTQEFLYRDTVISSSNNNNKVDFPAGGKSVFTTLPSSVAASIIASTTYSFSNIDVAGQSTVIADSTADTLTLAAGTGIDITTNAATDTITITGTDLNAVSQDIVPTIDSDGTTGYNLGSPTAKWKHLYVATGSIYIGDVKLSNTAGKLVATKVINPGEPDEAEDPEDSNAGSELGGGGSSLTISNGNGTEVNNVNTILIENFVNLGSGTVGLITNGVDGLTGNTTFEPSNEGNVNYELDIQGQHQDSNVTLRLYRGDGTGNNDLGPAISLGRHESSTHRAGVIAIGNSDVGYNSKKGGVYIGSKAGWNNVEDQQGEHAIAIGTRAAYTFAYDRTITLNATGANLDPGQADSLYIKPIREGSAAKALYYNTTTGEVTYYTPGSGGGGSTGDFIFDGTAITHPENDHYIDFDEGSAGNLSIVANNGKAAKITSGNKVVVNVGDTEHWAMITRSQQHQNGNGVEAAAVIYDSINNIIMIHSKDVNGDDHLVISKFASSGTLIWQKQISDQMDPDQSHDLAVDSGDNVIVAISNETGPFNDILIFKLDVDDGSIIWQKQYTPSVPVPVVEGDFTLVSTTIGSGQHNGSDAQTVYIQGLWPQLSGYTFRSSSDGVTFTTYGPIVYAWANEGTGQTVLFFALNTFGGSNLDGGLYYSASGMGPNEWQELGSMVVSGNNIFVSGRYQENSGTSTSQGFVFKASVVDGSLNWYRAFDFAVATYGYGMEVGADGNPVVVGVSSGEAPDGAWVTKFDASTGDALWSNIIFNGEENVSYTGSDVTVDSQNNIYVSVNANQQIVHDIGNNTSITIAYIVKLNSTGTIQWSRRAGPGPCGSVATGIDHDSAGNVYLAALTTVQKNPVRDISETGIWLGINQNVLAICKYNSSGEVLWQRYVKSDFYNFIASRDEGNGDAEWGANNNRGRALSVSLDGKLAVQVTVQQRDPDGYAYENIYYESITFQINQDGRELTLGSGTALFTVEESRIPGKFITVPGTLYTDPPVDSNNNIFEDVVVSTPTFNIFDGILAQELSTSAAYEYVFGNDGTLTIPNDGDIKLTQTEVGWFSIFGPANNNGANVDVRAHCVDAATGDVYVVGESDSLGRGFVGKYNNQGEILWSISTYENGDGMSNRANAVKIHPTTGNIIVLLEVYGMQTNSVLLQIDPDTAKVVASVGIRDTGNQGSCIAYDFDFMSNGDIAIVGRKYDEYKSWPITAQAGSAPGSLVLNKSDITGLTPDTNWYVAGTGITGRTVVTGVTDNGTTWTVTVTDPIAFDSAGSWTLDQPLYGEAFVLVGGGLEFAITWSKVLSSGGTDTERYLSVAVDSNNNVYAAGEMIARNNVAGADLNDIWCAVVSKFNGTGTHQWTKVLNDTLNNCYAKCIVVRGNTVVVSHNNTNNNSTVVTKLDSTGSINWQRLTYSNDDSSVAVDTNGDVYAVVESNFENYFGDIIKVIKFNSVGDITWRKFFGTKTLEVTTYDRFKNGRNLTLYGDHIYVSGYTNAHYGSYRNGFMVKLPKAGDCDGYYGTWAVQLESYNVNEITSTAATAFTPLAGTGEFEVVGYDMVSNWWDPSNGDYYHTLDIIRDRDGGAVEFADGTRQTSSAQQIPQRRLSNGEDHRLCLDDMGKHIFVKSNDSQIAVPYNADNRLPIGFTVVVVNDTGAPIDVTADGGGISIRSGSNSGPYWYVDSYGMATLIKVDTDYWYISGNVGQP